MIYELLQKKIIKIGLQTFLKLWDQMKTTLFHNLAPFTHTHRGRVRGEKNNPKKTNKKQKQPNRSGKKGKPKSSSIVP
jgi:hypothetical protein